MGCSYLRHPRLALKIILIMPIALIDGNNFYASCEEVMNPSLKGKPLVILSNNDGCVIARNAKAKTLGIKMGQPFFKLHTQLNALGVEVRSSNYALYGDMSQRFMNLLNNYCEDIEIYSIDEAFLKIQRPINKDLGPWAKNLRAFIYQNLGISTAIGIGINKSQAKLANYLAKNFAQHAGVFDFEISKYKEYWLESVAIENVWGIGRKLAYWCQLEGIQNARQLRDMPSNKLKKKYGIKGIRLQAELRGECCFPILTQRKSKKETCVSRSFSRPICSLNDLKQAIATYSVLASEKLRKQKQCAGSITIFVRTSMYTSSYYSESATKRLEYHSNDTFILLEASLELIPKLFQPNRLLSKAGVIMKDLVNSDHCQLKLFEDLTDKKRSQREELMQIIDRLNQRYGRNIVTWAACGVNPKWSMQRKYLSNASTTQFTQIPIINA